MEFSISSNVVLCDGQLFSAVEDKVEEGIVGRWPSSALAQAIRDDTVGELQLSPNDEFARYLPFVELCLGLQGVELSSGRVWAVQLPEYAKDTYLPEVDLDSHKDLPLRPIVGLQERFALYVVIAQALGFWSAVANFSARVKKQKIDNYYLGLFISDPYV